LLLYLNKKASIKEAFLIQCRGAGVNRVVLESIVIGYHWLILAGK